jgi:hypothetical protein
MLGVLSWSDTLRRALRRVWERWKVIAHAIGNFQARVLLTVFYFVVVPPFAVIAKLFTDPLSLRAPRGDSYWVPRARPASAERSGTRQF